MLRHVLFITLCCSLSGYGTSSFQMPDAKAGKGTQAPSIPHELEDLVKQWGYSIEQLEETYGTGIKAQKDSDSVSRLLSSMFGTFEPFLGKDEGSLSLPPSLKNKLSQWIQKSETNGEKEESKSSKEIKIKDLLDLKDKILSNGLDESEKSELIGALLIHFEQKYGSSPDRTNALKNILNDYLKIVENLDPDKKIKISEDLHRHFYADGRPRQDLKASELLGLIKEKGLPSTRGGVDLFKQLLEWSLNEPEDLDLAFKPIWKQLYFAERSRLPGAVWLSAPSTLEQAIELLNRFRASRIPVPGSFEPPFIPGAVGGSGGGGHRAFKQIANPSLRQVSQLSATPELEACVDYIRGKSSKNQMPKRYNTEIQLPGALCAGTVISTQPQKDLASYISEAKKNSGSMCPVKMATATHCTYGQRIHEDMAMGMKIAGRWITAHIQRIENYDFQGSYPPEPVEGGNADLETLNLMIPCASAAHLNIAAVPTHEEIAELGRMNDMAIVMQQNSEINARLDGENAATIGAMGIMDRTPQGLGNFLSFNTRMGGGMNQSSGQDEGPGDHKRGNIFDSHRIKGGDSGGSALSCLLDDTGKVKKVVYLGAISHIEVTGNQFEGTVGGIASGQSLVRLSDALWKNRVGSPEQPAYASAAGKSHASNALSQPTITVSTK